MEATRYVWKPDRPRMDQTEKKQITSSTAVEEGVKEHQQQPTRVNRVNLGAFSQSSVQEPS